MKAPKDSKGRLLTRRREVYNTLNRLYATRHHRPGGKVTDGVMRVVTGREVSGSDRRVVTGSDGGLPNSSDGR